MLSLGQNAEHLKYLCKILLWSNLDENEDLFFPFISILRLIDDCLVEGKK